MYVDPMTIYREYVQNSADAIDDAQEAGLLPSSESGRVEIFIDQAGRSIRIRDNGTGVPSHDFAQRLSNLGASSKRGTSARGFRGVGRLAGLGYCQELVFRSKGENESVISELRWDCRTLKSALRAVRPGEHLVEMIRDTVSTRHTTYEGPPTRFFEVELKGVVRHRNDRLLSPVVVRDYLAQVAPVPFSPDFRFGSEISAALSSHVKLGNIEIRINGTEQVFRPHRNYIDLGEGDSDKIEDLEVKELVGVEGGVAAVAWVLHHGYQGALPSSALLKGIRLRAGNVQVGDHALLEELFPETRFNAWAIGEVHIFDGKVLPNGRRDHFEQSVHFDNLLGQLTPIVRDIAKRCRDSSIGRKWLREFDAHRTAAIDSAKAVVRGGISKTVRQSYVDAAAKSIKAMRKVVATRHIGEEMRATLHAQADEAETRVTKLLGSKAAASEPFARFQPAKRAAYEQIIALVYECASNSAAASALVEKILARLELHEKEKLKRTTATRRKKSRSARR
jgi:molecular chaperone HtpG